MKNTNEILEAVKTSEATKVMVAIPDIDGILRGKLVSKEKFFSSVDKNTGFCNVVFGWDMNDAVYENSKATGWHTGFPDSLVTIDLNSFRKIPWREQIPFFLGDFNKSKDMAGVCPRTLLKKICQQSAEMDFTPMFANEYEWFNFNETPDSLKEKQFTDPTPLTPGMFGYSVLRSSQKQPYFDDIFDLMPQFGIPIEGMHTETGDGVYEACIEYTDAVEAADRAMLFKTGVKEIAYRYNIVATFMAKWNPDLPGSGGHIHQSLWDKNGTKNLFHDPNNSHKMSKVFEHYLAGQLHCLPHIMPMYAPVVNSYKRLVEGSWAATSVSWGMDNRTTALRVINTNEESTRLETRIPGADVNPYLGIAAALASGLYGIKHELPLEIDPTEGNEYDRSGSTHLPETLEEAVRTMKASELATELFGEDFTDHFIRTREWEWQQFSKAVTNWELKRYFEII